eukprot:Pompholyxophrys_sp_v1_NODE_58_length_2795_cov_7.517518.p2 type:complete len:130 gc:universal NODE_58_length_2795_cov_7.517518:1952-2341(+)
MRQNQIILSVTSSNEALKHHLPLCNQIYSDFRFFLPSFPFPPDLPFFATNCSLPPRPSYGTSTNESSRSFSNALQKQGWHEQADHSLQTTRQCQNSWHLLRRHPCLPNRHFWFRPLHPTSYLMHFVSVP